MPETRMFRAALYITMISMVGAVLVALFVPSSLQEQAGLIVVTGLVMAIILLLVDFINRVVKTQGRAPNSPGSDRSIGRGGGHETREYHRARRWFGLLPGDDVILHLKPNCQHCSQSHVNLRYQRIKPPFPKDTFNDRSMELNFRAICPQTGQELFGCFPIGEAKTPLVLQWLEDTSQPYIAPVEGPKYTLLSDLGDLLGYAISGVTNVLFWLLMRPADLVIWISSHFGNRGEQAATLLCLVVALFSLYETGASLFALSFGSAIAWFLAVIWVIGSLVFALAIIGMAQTFGSVLVKFVVGAALGPLAKTKA